MSIFGSTVSRTLDHHAAAVAPAVGSGSTLRSYLARRSVQIVASLGLGLAIAIVAVATLLVQHLRHRDLTDSSADLATYAMMLSAHLESSFMVLEAMQGGVLDQLHSEGITSEDQFVSLMSSATTHQLLTARVGSIPYVGGMTLIDRRGMLINSTYYWPMPYRDLSDRQYYKLLSQTAGPDRFVTTPLQNRATNEWTIYVARRISAPNGEFLGILLGEISFSYFQAFFAEIAPQPDAVVSMFDLGGVMLVRQPPIPGIVGTSPDTGARQLLARGIDRGTIRNVSPIDGKDRLIAIHPLPHYPLVVSLSRSVSAVLEPWRQQRRYVLIITAALELALAIIFVLVMRHLRGREQLAELEASLVKAEGERAVAAENARFNVAVSAMTQGLCMLDRDRRLIVSNPRFAELFALSPPTLAKGVPLTRLVRGILASGVASIADIRSLKKVIAVPGGLTSIASATWDLADGRSLLVSVDRMPEEGWLITATDITERRRTEAQITHMARHDALTGLANRTQFRERLEEAMRLAGRGRPHALLCLDLDHFKTINDTMGHKMGDAVLQSVAARLRRQCREIDLIARLGGDEFVIIQPLMQRPSAERALAERIIEELSLTFDLLGHQFAISCSIGVAVTPDDALDPDELLKSADLALYKAKADGRNCYRFFEPAMDEKLQRRRALEAQLRGALAKSEFRLVYQPLVNTRSGKVSAFEALLRWSPPDWPGISPAEFIPIAEEMGLIIPLGTWVLERACREALNWPQDVAVAVNVSPVQFRRGDFVDMVCKTLDDCGLAPQRLEIEVTEGLFLDDPAAASSTLRLLRDLGVRVSMDDFGTGYSSLSYLLKFPFDKVKLDRSFICDMGRGGPHEVIVEAVTTMCQGLGLQTTGEGVETEEQLRLLMKLGCTEVQGFLFGKPVPAEQISPLLTEIGERAERAEDAGKMPADLVT